MFGVATLINEKGKFGSGKGVRNVKKNLLIPKIASLVSVAVGDHRQLTEVRRTRENRPAAVC